MTQVVIGTAGHIDHGKTALVQALTGTNTDQLAEEQARGMTIDLGFAFLTDEITIIDVPGHEKFIRNMVSGVSTIQVALVVIAADDGVMPQTIEHLEILELLKISYGVIAITKTDLVENDWLDLVEEDIRNLCEGTFLESSKIIRTSVVDGCGINELRAILLKLSSNIKSKSNRGFFRLQVDRSFIKTGFGNVVTGTVISGELCRGYEVQILPSEKIGRVRGLQSHGKPVEKVKLGDRAAINFTGINKMDLWRGVEIVEPGWLEPTKQAIANITIIPKTNWKIKSKQRVKIHIGTQELLARITHYKSVLKGGDTANVLINFEEPAVVALEDRFVIRSYSPMVTIGGGIVLAIDQLGAPKNQKKWIAELSVKTDERYLQFIQKHYKHPQTLEQWCKIFHVSMMGLKTVLSKHKLLTTNGEPLIYTEENLNKCMELILSQLQNFHSEQPYQEFMKGKELKEKLDFKSNWFEFVLSKLIANKMLKQIQSGYALASFNLKISVDDEKRADKILKIVENFGFQPVTVKKIMDKIDFSNKQILEFLHVLKSQGLVVQISENMWSSHAKIDKIKQILNKYFDKNQRLSVAQFKDLTSLTRKSVIPLLEYFDQKNITLRDENERLKGEKL